jgi:hypothetical protein
MRKIKMTRIPWMKKKMNLTLAPRDTLEYLASFMELIRLATIKLKAITL